MGPLLGLRLGHRSPVGGTSHAKLWGRATLALDHVLYGAVLSELRSRPRV